MMHGAETSMALGDGRRSLTRDALDHEVAVLAALFIYTTVLDVVRQLA